MKAPKVKGTANSHPSRTTSTATVQAEEHGHFFTPSQLQLKTEQEITSNGAFNEERTAQVPFFSPKSIQPKLTIGQPGDKYEQEADTMADQVMRKLEVGNGKWENGSGKSEGKLDNKLQQKCADCEEKEKISKKEEEGEPELSLEEEALQAKPAFESEQEVIQRQVDTEAREEEVPTEVPDLSKQAIPEAAIQDPTELSSVSAHSSLQKTEAPQEPEQEEVSASEPSLALKPSMEAKPTNTPASPEALQPSLTHPATSAIALQEETEPTEEESLSEEPEIHRKELSDSTDEGDNHTGTPVIAPLPLLHRKEEEEEGLTDQPDISPRAEADHQPATASSDLQSQLNASKGSGGPLSEDTRSSMESAFGADFSGVRIHTDPSSVQMNQELGAQAFTHGSDVYFNEGKFDTGSSQGNRLLAHELTHVVQQGGNDSRNKNLVQTAQKKTNIRKATPKEKENVPKVKGEFAGFITKKNGPIEIYLENFSGKKYLAQSDTSWIKDKIKLPKKEKRKTKQVKLWKNQVRDSVGKQLEKLSNAKLFDGKVYSFTLKTSNKTKIIGPLDAITEEVLIPFWSFDDGQPFLFDVEHMVDWQLAGKQADNIKNLILLQRSRNLSLGGLVKKQLYKHIDHITSEYRKTFSGLRRSAEGNLETFDVYLKSFKFETDDTYDLEDHVFYTPEELEKPRKYGNPYKKEFFDIRNEKLPEDKFLLFTSAGRVGYLLPKDTKDEVYGSFLVTTKYDHHKGMLERIMLIPLVQDEAGVLSEDPKGKKALATKRFLDPMEDLPFDVQGPDTYTLNTARHKAKFANRLKKLIVGLEGASPIELEDPVINGLEMIVKGKVIPNISIFQDVEIGFQYENGYFYVFSDIPLAKVASNFPKPFKVNKCKVIVEASSDQVLSLSGYVSFIVNNLGEGELHAIAGKGIAFGGSFSFNSKWFNPADISFEYIDGKWFIAGEIGILPGSIPGIESAKLIVQYSDKVFSAKGNAKLSVPGIETVTLEAVFDKEGGYRFLGSADLKKMKGIKGGNVTVIVASTGEDDDLKLSISGEAEPDLPSSLNIDAKLKIAYSDGIFDIGTTVNYEKGKFSGMLAVGVTNRKVDKKGKPEKGAANETGDFVIFGYGELTVDLLKGITGTIAVRLTPENEITVAGEIEQKKDFQPFGNKGVDFKKEIVKIPEITIPVFGVPGLSVFFGVSGGAYFSLKWAPLVLRGLMIKFEETSLENPDKSKIKISGTMASELEARAYMNVKMILGAKFLVLELKGDLAGNTGVKITAQAGGDIAASWDPNKGIQLDEIRVFIDVTPQAFIALTAGINIDLDLFFFDINLYSKEWTLAEGDLDLSALTLKLDFPIQFDEEGNMKPLDYEKIKPISSVGGKEGEKVMDQAANKDADADREEAEQEIREEIAEKVDEQAGKKNFNKDKLRKEIIEDYGNDPKFKAFVVKTIEEELKRFERKKFDKLREEIREQIDNKAEDGKFNKDNFINELLQKHGKDPDFIAFIPRAVEEEHKGLKKRKLEKLREEIAEQVNDEADDDKFNDKIFTSKLLKTYKGDPEFKPLIPKIVEEEVKRFKKQQLEKLREEIAEEIKDNAKDKEFDKEELKKEFLKKHESNLEFREFIPKTVEEELVKFDKYYRVELQSQIRKEVEKVAGEGFSVKEFKADIMEDYGENPKYRDFVKTTLEEELLMEEKYFLEKVRIKIRDKIEEEAHTEDFSTHKVIEYINEEYEDKRSYLDKPEHQSFIENTVEKEKVRFEKQFETRIGEEIKGKIEEEAKESDFSISEFVKDMQNEHSENREYRAVIYYKSFEEFHALKKKEQLKEREETKEEIREEIREEVEEGSLSKDELIAKLMEDYGDDPEFRSLILTAVEDEIAWFREMRMGLDQEMSFQEPAFTKKTDDGVEPDKEAIQPLLLDQSPLQAKLMIAQEADENEQEADAVADQVVQRLNHSDSFSPDSLTSSDEQSLPRHELPAIAPIRGLNNQILQSKKEDSSSPKEKEALVLDQVKLSTLKKHLEGEEKVAAISTMAKLNAKEVDHVLSSGTFKKLALKTFGNDGMFVAVATMCDGTKGDLYYGLNWMLAEGTDWLKVKAILKRMAPVISTMSPNQRDFLFHSVPFRDIFVSVCNNEEMAEAVDLLGFNLVQKVIWMGAEGTSYQALLKKIERTQDLAERLELYRSGRALSVFIDTVDNQEMRVIVDKIGGTVKQKLSWLLAEGEFNYMPEPGEVLPPKPSEQPVAADEPVVFAFNTEDSSVYASVTPPGHSSQEVATYLFGVSDASILGKVPKILPPGQPIQFGKDRPLSAQAKKDMQKALDSGTAIRTKGVSSAEESKISYQFNAGGKIYQLTPMQMGGMISSIGRKYSIQAERIRSLSQSLNEIRDDHEKGTNTVVRGISDVLGDVDLPNEGFANKAIKLALAARELLKHIDTTDVGKAQKKLGKAMQLFLMAVQAYEVSDMKWDYYIKGTIEGAQAAVTTLEIVRDVSFSIAAGLAGAVAAPLAYGAVATSLTAGGTTTLTTGGTLLAGGVAITTGAATGSVVKGGLEFTGASGGELFAMGVTPGEQQFDWGYVGDRTKHGLKTGALEGAMGAASHFQGAFISSRFSQAFAASKMGQMTIGALAGGSSELVLATAEEFIAPGKEGFSATNIFKRTALGFFMGGATSFIPIDGLYRAKPGGGGTWIPFKGQVVTPEWMLASPWHFVQPRGVAASGTSITPRGSNRYQAINQLPADQLPVLPEGYSWARVNGSEWAIVRPPKNPDIDVHVWGPDANGRYDFTVRQRETGSQPSRMLESDARTKTATRPQSERQDPFPTADYIEPTTGTAYRRGHGIDHADTTGSIGPTDATADPANFSPQTRDWNDFERNHLVSRIRRGRDPIDPDQVSLAGPNATYKEISYYSKTPLRTQSGEAIPDGLYMVVTDANGVAQYAFHVPRGYARVGGTGSVSTNLGNLQVSVDQIPIAVINAGGFSVIAPSGTARGAASIDPTSQDQEK